MTSKSYQCLIIHMPTHTRIYYEEGNFADLCNNNYIMHIIILIL